MKLCRICYEKGTAANPLKSPCDCRGSVKYIHKRCLGQWIRASSTQCCELCRVSYISEAIVLEPLVDLPYIVMHLATRAPHLFVVQLFSYFIYFVQTNDPLITFDGFMTGVSQIIPYLLLSLTGLQVFVYIPSISGLNDVHRYWRYVFSCRVRTMDASPPWFLGLCLAGLVASFFNALLGIVVVVPLLPLLYHVHTLVILRINRDIFNDSMQIYYEDGD